MLIKHRKQVADQKVLELQQLETVRLWGKKTKPNHDVLALLIYAFLIFFFWTLLKTGYPEQQLLFFHMAFLYL